MPYQKLNVLLAISNYVQGNILLAISLYDTENIAYVYVWCITNQVYRQQKCNFRVVTVRLADFDIPEKVPQGRKLSQLFSYMMVHTHKLGQRFCRSLTRAIVLSIKRKTIFIAEHLRITSQEEEHKVSSGIGKVLTKYKTSSDFYAVMHIFISRRGIYRL